MKNSKKLIFITLILTATFLPLTPCLGATALEQMKSAISGVNLPTGEAENVAGGLIQAFLSIMGILFLALMIYGGFKWMIAQGREEEVKKAKDTIQAAIIGLAIVLAAYAITYYVLVMFYQAAAPSG